MSTREAEPAWLGGFDSALDHAWGRLEQAVTSRDDALRLPVLATAGLDGSPQARTVVLRAADRQGWRLRIHTDARSAKAGELDADARLALLFYDPVEKLQLRVSGTAVLHRGDALAREAWQASAEQSRQCYFAEPGPGTPLDAPGNALPDDPQAFEQEAPAFAVFTVIEVTLRRLEWLHLAASGHRRAAHERAEDGAITSTWLVP